MKKLFVVPILATFFGLAACATGPNGDIMIFGKDTGVTFAQAQATEAQALATACPIVAVLNANPPKMSAFQAQALKQLAVICPPNAPPTDVIVAATDILAAYEALSPLVHK